MSDAQSASPSAAPKTGLFLAAMAGIALATCLVLYYGLAEVGDAFLTAGWRGIAAITAVHLISLVFCALAWRVLMTVSKPPHVDMLFLWARWVRDSVGNVLAIVPGAGEVAGARELSLHSVRLGVAAGTTVVDMTTEMLSQLLYTLIGLALLFAYHPDEKSAWWAAAGLAVATVAVVGFLIAQRNGLIRFLETLPARLGLTQTWEGLPAAESVHTAIQSIYQHTGRVVASVGLHLLAWIAGAAETWIALWFMGHPLSVVDVISLESLVFALRTAAFVVPWAAGVQEGGYIVIGALFGLGPDVALALSLLKRARELTVGVPGLVAWQWAEGKRLLQRRLVKSQ
jgi:putative membrane protein